MNTFPVAWFDQFTVNLIGPPPALEFWSFNSPFTNVYVANAVPGTYTSLMLFHSLAFKSDTCILPPQRLPPAVVPKSISLTPLSGYMSILYTKGLSSVSVLNVLPCHCVVPSSVYIPNLLAAALGVIAKYWSPSAFPPIPSATTEGVPKPTRSFI